VRRRIVVAIVLVAAASVVLFALPLAVAVHNSYRDEELLRLQRDAVAATRGIDVGSASRDAIELPRSADELAVYDRTGQRLAGNGPPRGDALVMAALRSGRPGDQAAGGQLVASVPLVVAERVRGAVRIARSDATVTSRTRRAWLTLVGLGVLVVALAGAAAMIIARRLAAPLERIAVTARRLGEGDFTARAQPSGVPELDAVGQVLEITAQRLGELLSRERAFSADASHQLRTPLAALRIELEAMELRDDPPAELAPALAQVDRLQTTIDTLLTVARDVPRIRRTFALTELIAGVQERWHGPLARAGRPLRVVIEDTDTIATGSPAVILEILSVLLSNAAEHGAGVVTLTVRGAASGWVAIDVADEGPGLTGPAEAVFERGVGSERPGHGIGLALARALADAEGARLSLSRAAPHPVFSLLLPGIREGHDAPGPVPA
jgi:signal transduction histidine kinase